MTKLKEVPAQAETKSEPAAVPAPVQTSMVDQVLDMVGRLDSMRKQAVEDLLTQKRQIEEKLAMIGWSDVSVRAKASGRPSSAAHCSICDIDGHDRRQHRFQGANKRKFTPEQLREIGK